MNRATTINRRLRIRAADALQRSPVPALRFLTVEERPGELVLSGRLPTATYLQMAREMLTPFLNGRELVDRVVVMDQE